MRSHDGSVKMTKRSGWLLNVPTVSARPLPTPPVRFTIVCTLRRSITSSRSAGVAMVRMASPCPTPPTLRARKVRWVWTSITGNRAFSTRVSLTCNMLFGSKSGSASAPAAGACAGA